MGTFMKTLRMTVSVFSLILASAVPGSAQTNVFVNGNTSFTVTWQGVEAGATLLATATFTVSNWTGSSFVMTVTNVANTMPTSPNINARLTAFGFGLTPEGHIQQSGRWKHLPWAFTNFPAFQRVDVCLTSGSGCAGGGGGGLNQGQSTTDSHSVTITGDVHEWGHDHADSCEISNQPRVPGDRWGRDRPATDGCERPHHYEDAQPEHRHPRGDRHVHRDGLERRDLAVERHGDRDRDAAAGLTITALSGAGWTCTVATRICTRSDALGPGASYPAITVTTSVGAGAAPGTVTNTAVVSGGGDSNSTNNTATDPTIIAAPAPGMDLTIAKTHSPRPSCRDRRSRTS